MQQLPVIYANRHNAVWRFIQTLSLTQLPINIRIRSPLLDYSVMETIYILVVMRLLSERYSSNTRVYWRKLFFIS